MDEPCSLDPDLYPIKPRPADREQKPNSIGYANLPGSKCPGVYMDFDLLAEYPKVAFDFIYWHEVAHYLLTGKYDTLADKKREEERATRFAVRRMKEWGLIDDEGLYDLTGFILKELHPRWNLLHMHWVLDEYTKSSNKEND
jgi:hypothetical protein